MESTTKLNGDESLCFLNFQLFFESATADQHLIFLENWLELLMTNPDFNGNDQITELLHQYQLLNRLYENSYAFQQELIDRAHQFKITAPYLASLELDSVCFRPRFLTDEEILNPALCIAFLGEKKQLESAQQLLFNWLQKIISPGQSSIDTTLFFPLYNKTKKLIEASWIIYQRWLSKKADVSSLKKPTKFEDTCPLLLNDIHYINPYLEIEQFFTGSSLNQYHKDLRFWFKAAVTVGLCVEQAENLLYFHDQLIRMIQAAYLIVQHQIPYRPEKPYSLHAETFGEWVMLLKQKDILTEHQVNIQYELMALNEMELNNPFDTIRTILTLDNIREIRYGLREWLNSGLSKNESIMDIETNYVFELYEKMEKLLALCFILVVPDAAVGKPNRKELQHD